MCNFDILDLLVIIKDVLVLIRELMDLLLSVDPRHNRLCENKCQICDCTEWHYVYIIETKRV